MYFQGNYSVDFGIVYYYTNDEMDAKPIVNHVALPSQVEGETSPPNDGLRFLGRIIACHILAKRSACSKKSTVILDNPQTLEDSR